MRRGVIIGAFFESEKDLGILQQAFRSNFGSHIFFQPNYQNNFLAIRDFCCYVGSHI